MAGTATAPTRIAANNPFFSVVIASSVHDAVGVEPIPRSEPRRDTPQAEVIGSPSERLIARVYRDLPFSVRASASACDPPLGNRLAHRDGIQIEQEQVLRFAHDCRPAHATVSSDTTQRRLVLGFADGTEVVVSILFPQGRGRANRLRRRPGAQTRRSGR